MDRVLRSCAAAPAALFALILGAVVGGLMPAAVELMVATALLAGLAALRLGVGEAVASLVLGRCRPLTEAESLALLPVLTALSAVALAPGRVFVARDLMPDEGRAAPYGRGTTVVSPELMAELIRGSISTEAAAWVIGGAEASRQWGSPQWDLVWRITRTPWRLIAGGVRALTRPLAVLPLVTSVWHLRGVVGVVAVVQSIADGHAAAGVMAGGVMALSYLSPAASRAASRRRERAVTARLRSRLGATYVDSSGPHRQRPIDRAGQQTSPAGPAGNVSRRPHLTVVR